MAREGFSEGLGLPAPQAGHRVKLVRGAWLSPGDLEQHGVREERAAVDPELVSPPVADLLQPHCPLLGVGSGSAGPDASPVWVRDDLPVRKQRHPGHALQQILTLLAGQSPAEAPHLGELIGGSGTPHNHFQQRLVAHDSEGSLVARARDPVPPGERLTQERHLPGCQVTGSPHARDRVLEIVAGLALPAGFLQEPALIERPGQAPSPVQARTQEVGELAQVDGVARRVFQHVVRQGAPGPVRALEFLGELDSQMALEQGGQTQGALTQQGGGHLGIEQPPYAHAQISVEEAQVVVRAVHEHFDRRVLERTPQGVAGVEGKRIDDLGGAGCADLEQAQPVGVPVEARRLAIQGEPRLACEGPAQQRELGRVIDEGEGHAGGWSLPCSHPGWAAARRRRDHRRFLLRGGLTVPAPCSHGGAW